jgi:hypothetical protein
MVVIGYDLAHCFAYDLLQLHIHFARSLPVHLIPGNGGQTRGCLRGLRRYRAEIDDFQKWVSK